MALVCNHSFSAPTPSEKKNRSRLLALISTHSQGTTKQKKRLPLEKKVLKKTGGKTKKKRRGKTGGKNEEQKDKNAPIESKGKDARQKKARRKRQGKKRREKLQGKNISPSVGFY